MRIERALDIRKQLYSRFLELEWWSKFSHMSSSDFNKRFIEIKNETPNGTPEWVFHYLDGVRDYFINLLYRNELQYCYKVNGKLYSTDRSSDNYYEKHGIGPAEAYKQCTEHGHYWKGTDIPWFIGSEK